MPGGRASQMLLGGLAGAELAAEVEYGGRRYGVSVIGDTVVLWRDAGYGYMWVPSGYSASAVTVVAVAPPTIAIAPTCVGATGGRCAHVDDGIRVALAHMLSYVFSYSYYAPNFYTAAWGADRDADVDAIIVRRGTTADDVASWLSYDQPTARALKESAGAFEALLARYEGEMREAGYGDVADLIRTLLAAASILA